MAEAACRGLTSVAKDHDVPRALKQELERVYNRSKLPARSAPAGRKRKAAE